MRCANVVAERQFPWGAKQCMRFATQARIDLAGRVAPYCARCGEEHDKTGDSQRLTKDEEKIWLLLES